MPIVFFAALAAVLTGAVIAYFYREHVHESRLRLRVEKLYASQMFEEMLPVIHCARHRQLEQLAVDKTGVVLRFLHDGEIAFLMRPNGYRYLSVEQQEAMRAVWEECVPQLRDQSKYHVLRKRSVLLNGEVEYTYQYTISIAFKNRLTRACYYDGSFQPRSW